MADKILFIDRDGTLIKEPPADFQVDTLEKLEFMPGVFRNLYFLQKNLDYKLVIVSNQDGMGTPSFPEEAFWVVQDKMIKAFENEGITFADVLIDPSFPEDNSPNRKPRTGLVTKYLSGGFDKEHSYIIGDRLTDMQLAANMNAQGIFFANESRRDEAEQAVVDTLRFVSDSWDAVYAFLSRQSRVARVIRNTSETKIEVELMVDGVGKSEITTGIGFFDHMLEQLARHSGCDLFIRVNGDTHVDEHHTIEDTALALGEAFAKALGNKLGLDRYGFCLPMDDCLAQVAIDFSGRSWLVWEVDFKREKVGEMPTEMFMHFFKSFSDTARCNLNIKAEGENEHHKIEAIFKALARAIRMAKRKEPYIAELPSTKGVL